MEQPQEGERALQSPWVWGFFIFIAIVLAANGVLLYLAYATRPGLVAEGYYESGKNYLSRSSSKSGGEWGLEIQSPFTPVVGVPAILRVVSTGGKGAAELPDAVMLFAYRPADERADFSLPMTAEKGGAFSIEPRFPLKGTWDLIIEAKKGDARVTLARRISVLAR